MLSRHIASTADRPNKDGPCCLGQWQQQAKPEATAHQQDQTISSWGLTGGEVKDHHPGEVQWPTSQAKGHCEVTHMVSLVARAHSVAGMLLTLGCCLTTSSYLLETFRAADRTVYGYGRTLYGLYTAISVLSSVPYASTSVTLTVWYVVWDGRKRLYGSVRLKKDRKSNNCRISTK